MATVSDRSAKFFRPFRTPRVRKKSNCFLKSFEPKLFLNFFPKDEIFGCQLCDQGRPGVKDLHWKIQKQKCRHGCSELRVDPKSVQNRQKQIAISPKIAFPRANMHRILQISMVVKSFEELDPGFPGSTSNITFHTLE